MHFILIPILADYIILIHKERLDLPASTELHDHIVRFHRPDHALHIRSRLIWYVRRPDQPDGFRLHEFPPPARDRAEAPLFNHDQGAALHQIHQFRVLSRHRRSRILQNLRLVVEAGRWRPDRNLWFPPPASGSKVEAIGAWKGGDDRQREGKIHHLSICFYALRSPEVWTVQLGCCCDQETNCQTAKVGSLLDLEPCARLYRWERHLWGLNGLVIDGPVGHHTYHMATSGWAIFLGWPGPQADAHF